MQDNIQKLRRILVNEDELKNFDNEYCSETESEGEEISSRPPESYQLREETVDEGSPIKDFLSRSLIPESPRLTKSSHSQQHARKRTRVIISDDEDNSDTVEDVAISNEGEVFKISSFIMHIYLFW